MKTKKIIFICRGNVFRSRIAENYFKKKNKNKNIKVISGGVMKCNPAGEWIIKTLNGLGIKQLRL